MLLKSFSGITQHVKKWLGFAASDSEWTWWIILAQQTAQLQKTGDEKFLPRDQKLKKILS